MANIYDFDTFIISNYERASGSKLFMDINGKTFGYKGDIDSGYFIEELASSLIKESRINISDDISNLQVLITFPTRIVLVSLKDFSEEYEETVVYYLSEFKQEEISAFLSELIYDDENVVFVDYLTETDSFKVVRSIDGFESDVPAYQLKLTKVVTGFHKIVSHIIKVRGDIAAVLFLLAVPAGLYFGLSSNLSGSDDEKIKKLEIEFKLLNAKHIQERAALEDYGNKYRQVEKIEDLFTSPSLISKIDTLQPTNIIKVEEDEDFMIDSGVPYGGMGLPDLKNLDVPTVDTDLSNKEIKSDSVPKHTSLPTFDTNGNVQ